MARIRGCRSGRAFHGAGSEHRGAAGAFLCLCLAAGLFTGCGGDGGPLAPAGGPGGTGISTGQVRVDGLAFDSLSLHVGEPSGLSFRVELLQEPAKPDTRFRMILTPVEEAAGAALPAAALAGDGESLVLDLFELGELGGGEDEPAVRVSKGLRFESTTVSYEAGTGARRAAVRRAYQVQDYVGPGRYRLGLEIDGARFDLGTEMRIRVPEAPELCFSVASLSANYLELPAERPVFISMRQEPQLLINVEAANTGLALQGEVPVVFRLEIDGETHPLLVSRNGPYGQVEIGPSASLALTPAHSVAGASYGLYLTPEIYDRLAATPEDAVLSMHAELDPDNLFAELEEQNNTRVLPVVFLGGPVAKRAGTAGSPAGSGTDCPLGTYDSSSQECVIYSYSHAPYTYGNDHLKASLDLSPNRFAYQAIDAGGYEIPWAVDFQSNNDSKVNVNFSGSDETVTLFLADVDLVFDPDQDPGTGCADADSDSSNYYCLELQIVGIDVFPTIEGGIPETWEYSLDRYRKSVKKTILSGQVQLDIVTFVYDLGAKASVGLQGDLGFDYDPTYEQMGVFTKSVGPFISSSAWFSAGLGLGEAADVGIKGDVLLEDISLGLDTELDAYKVGQYATFDMDLPLKLTMIKGVIDLYVSILGFTVYSTALVHFDALEDTWDLYSTSHFFGSEKNLWFKQEGSPPDLSDPPGDPVGICYEQVDFDVSLNTYWAGQWEFDPGTYTFYASGVAYFSIKDSSGEELSLPSSAFIEPWVLNKEGEPFNVPYGPFSVTIAEKGVYTISFLQYGGTLLDTDGEPTTSFSRVGQDYLYWVKEGEWLALYWATDDPSQISYDNLTCFASVPDVGDMQSAQGAKVCRLLDVGEPFVARLAKLFDSPAYDAGFRATSTCGGSVDPSDTSGEGGGGCGEENVTLGTLSDYLITGLAAVEGFDALTAQNTETSGQTSVSFYASDQGGSDTVPLVIQYTSPGGADVDVLDVTVVPSGSGLVADICYLLQMNWDYVPNGDWSQSCSYVSLNATTGRFCVECASKQVCTVLAGDVCVSYDASARTPLTTHACTDDDPWPPDTVYLVDVCFNDVPLSDSYVDAAFPEIQDADTYTETFLWQPHAGWSAWETVPTGVCLDSYTLKGVIGDASTPDTLEMIVGAAQMSIDVSVNGSSVTKLFPLYADAADVPASYDFTVDDAADVANGAGAFTGAWGAVVTAPAADPDAKLFGFYSREKVVSATTLPKQKALQIVWDSEGTCETFLQSSGGGLVYKPVRYRQAPEFPAGVAGYYFKGNEEMEAFMTAKSGSSGSATGTADAPSTAEEAPWPVLITPRQMDLPLSGSATAYVTEVATFAPMSSWTDCTTLTGDEDDPAPWSCGNSFGPQSRNILDRDAPCLVRGDEVPLLVSGPGVEPDQVNTSVIMLADSSESVTAVLDTVTYANQSTVDSRNPEDPTVQTPFASLYPDVFFARLPMPREAGGTLHGYDLYRLEAGLFRDGEGTETPSSYQVSLAAQISPTEPVDVKSFTTVVGDEHGDVFRDANGAIEMNNMLTSFPAEGGKMLLTNNEMEHILVNDSTTATPCDIYVTSIIPLGTDLEGGEAGVSVGCGSGSCAQGDAIDVWLKVTVTREAGKATAGTGDVHVDTCLVNGECVSIPEAGSGTTTAIGTAAYGTQIGFMARIHGDVADAGGEKRCVASVTDISEIELELTFSSPVACKTGETNCSGTCTDLSSDSSHCGTCENACGENATCSSGTCACDEGYTNCSGTCADLSSDSSHCGTCGNACNGAGGEICSNGACGCPENHTRCDGVCTDLLWDDNNCGVCGWVCENIGCWAGACQSPE